MSQEPTSQRVVFSGEPGRPDDCGGCGGRHGGVPVRLLAATVAGNPLPPVKALDDPLRQAHVQNLVVELVGHAVVMPLDVDVVVQLDPRLEPVGVGVGLGGQRLERRPVQRLELGAARAGQTLERPPVALRVLLLVLLPEQAQGDVLLAGQLPPNLGPVRQRPLCGRNRRRRGYSNCSIPASVSCSDNGQLKPAASALRTNSPTVLQAMPQLRAIYLLANLHSHFNRRISLIFRIGNLSAGICAPFLWLKGGSISGPITRLPSVDAVPNAHQNSRSDPFRPPIPTLIL